MPIVYRCPECQHRGKAPSKAAGRKAKCPKCGERIKIEPEGEAPAKTTAKRKAAKATKAPKSATRKKRRKPPEEPPEEDAAEDDEAEEDDAPAEDEAPAADDTEDDDAEDDEAEDDAEDEDDEEDEDEPRKKRRGPARKGALAKKKKLGKKAVGGRVGGPKKRGKAGRAKGGRATGKRRRPKAAGGGALRVLPALSGAVGDVLGNLPVCLAAVFLFQVAVGIAAYAVFRVSIGIASTPGLFLILMLIGQTLIMAVASYFLQGLNSIWLALARKEKASLGQLVERSPLDGVTGALVAIALGLLWFVGVFALVAVIQGSRSGKAIIGSAILIFEGSCLFMLVSGFAQVYIVDQAQDFMGSLKAAGGLVTSAWAKMLGYAMFCLGAYVFTSIAVAVLLSMFGFNPRRPSLVSLLVNVLVSFSANAGIISVIGSSMVRLYLQRIEE